MHTDTWRVQKQGQYSSAVVLRGTEEDGDLEIVAKAYRIEGHSDEAIARLIAAAPEMLDALREARDTLTEMYEAAYPGDESDNDVTEVIDMVIAAIAKTEGRE